MKLNDLIQKAKDGDEEALNEIIKKCRTITLKVLNKYRINISGYEKRRFYSNRKHGNCGCN
jgi:hypothetical protein